MTQSQLEPENIEQSELEYSFSLSNIDIPIRNIHIPTSNIHIPISVFNIQYSASTPEPRPSSMITLPAHLHFTPTSFSTFPVACMYRCHGRIARDTTFLTKSLVEEKTTRREVLY